MNFVKLKEPRVEWFASKNDMSLKQQCLQLQLRSGNYDDCDFKVWRWRAKVKDGFKLHHPYSFLSMEREWVRIYSQNFALPTVQNIICLEMDW